MTAPPKAFYLNDIPAAMRREQWPIGAALMHRWFAGKGWAMPTAVKRGRQPAPPRAVDTASVTMAWAMAVPRFAAAQRRLLATWSRGERLGPSSGEVVAQVRRWMNLYRVAGDRPFRFGDLKRRVPVVDLDCAINREVVDSAWYGAVDDFYAAFGSALVRLAVSGMVEPVTGGWRVTIDQVGTYLRDSYDFNGDQPLGSWGPGGLSRIALLAPAIEVDVRRQPSPFRQGFAYFSVGNESFRRYRGVTGMGGDFMIYSDIRVQRLAQPVTVMVPR